jgi:hypothetical protein
LGFLIEPSCGRKFQKYIVPFSSKSASLFLVSVFFFGLLILSFVSPTLCASSAIKNIFCPQNLRKSKHFRGEIKRVQSAVVENDVYIVIVYAFKIINF